MASKKPVATLPGVSVVNGPAHRVFRRLRGPSIKTPNRNAGSYGKRPNCSCLDGSGCRPLPPEHFVSTVDCRPPDTSRSLGGRDLHAVGRELEQASALRPDFAF